MAQEKPAADGAAKTETPVFAIERVYVKDVSFETPLGPESFTMKWEPEVDLDLNNKSTSLENDLFEVVLRVTVTARQKGGDSSYYLIEVQQAGIFRVANFSDEDRKRVLATAAPNTLFPYIRETVDSLLIKASFPPLMLAPVNFEALLQAALKQKLQQGEKAPTIQ